MFIIVIGSLPSARFLAPTSYTSHYLQPSSSFQDTHHSFLSFSYSDYSLNHFSRPFSYQTLHLHHLSFLSLFYLAVSSRSLFPPSRPSINHPLSTHALFKSSVGV